MSSRELSHPVRAVLYGPREGQDGTFLSLKLDDRSIVPLNIPLSEKAEQALRACDWVFFGVIEKGLVAESFHVPLVPACSDTHWTGLDGAMLRPKRAVSSFMSFLNRRIFGEPLHVPDGLEDAAPAGMADDDKMPKLAPGLAFWRATAKESDARPVSLGRAWRRRDRPAVNPLSDVWSRQIA